MKSIKAGEKDIQENRLITFKELLAELKIDEKEILNFLHQRIFQRTKTIRKGSPDKNNSRVKNS
jgi:sulfur carrier protein ThiS